MPDGEDHSSFPCPFITNAIDDQSKLYALQSERGVHDGSRGRIYLWKADVATLDWQKQGLVARIPVEAQGLEDWSYPWMTPLDQDNWFLAFYAGSVSGACSIYGMSFNPNAPPNEWAVKHVGDTDPSTEGWTWTPTGEGMTTGPVAGPAWEVTDAGSDTRGYYVGTFDEAAAQSLETGFRLDVEVNVPGADQDLSGVAFAGIAFNNAVVDGTKDLDFSICLGSDAEGNAQVKFLSVDTVYNVGSDGFHLYSMVFNPATQLASLYVDDELLGTSAGRTSTSFSYSGTRFGSVSTIDIGSGHYSLVELTIADPQPGDANGNGVVDAADAMILAANWQTQSGATWAMGDFNGDGKVDGSDATLLAANWQGSSSAAASVPEPSISILLINLFGYFAFRVSSVRCSRHKR